MHGAHIETPQGQSPCKGGLVTESFPFSCFRIYSETVSYSISYAMLCAQGCVRADSRERETDVCQTDESGGRGERYDDSGRH